MKEQDLFVTSRHLRHSIASMVQGDPVKALIELITNSDDSYARLEEKGGAVTGRITVDVLERRGDEPSILRVSDDAEGFMTEDLDVKLGRLGESTSGLDDGLQVRGFFGDGLKEAILGLRRGGTVTSIRGGQVVSAKLYWKDDGTAKFVREGKPRPVTKQQRRELQLKGNGTVVEIEVHPDIRVPRHETLRTDLALHVALRDIVQNPDRQLVLRRLNSNGTSNQSDYVTYVEPVADPEFPPVTLDGSVPGFRGATFKIELKRAMDELSGYEEGMKRTGGLVVQSKRALVDVTLFDHENRPGTDRLYGRLVCDYLYEMLRKGEMVVTKYRSGLAKDNAFVKLLTAEVDRLLEPYVKAEARRQQQVEHPEDPQTRKRLEDARRELNKIARDELELSGPGEDPSSAAPFRFEHSTYRVYLGDKRLVRLLVKREILRGPVDLPLTISGQGLSVSPDHFHLEPTEATNDIVMAEAWLMGGEPGAGRISVTMGEYEAAAQVLVTERVLPDGPFAFDRDLYRASVAHWYDVTLKIQVSKVLPASSDVEFSVEEGNVKIRPGALLADPAQARGDWLTVHAQVYGDQIGREDTLLASMGELTARARVVISSKRKPAEKEEKGGLIKDIRFDELRQNPPQRTLFSPDGVITIYVNEPSIRRYLKRPEDRSSSVGRALQADLVLHAFCRYLAVRKVDSVFVSMSDIGNSTDAVLRQYDSLIKHYGERIHSIINPR